MALAQKQEQEPTPCEIIEFDETLIRVKRYLAKEIPIKRFNIQIGRSCFLLPKDDAYYEIGINHILLENVRNGELFVWTKGHCLLRALARKVFSDNTILISRRSLLWAR